MSQSPSPHVSSAPVGQENRLAPPATQPKTSNGRSASIPGRVAAALRGLLSLVTVNRKVTVGSCIIGFFVLVALLEPLFIHQNPLHYSPGAGPLPPTSAHWLGTNQANQDVFIQLVVGTRSTLFWAFLTGLAVVVIAVTVGLVSGFLGGIVDDVLSVVTNVFLVIPALPLAILAVEYFARTELTIAVVVAFTNWAWGARVLRAQTLSMRNREFVTAARASGERTWRVIFVEIFPNQLSIVAASFITTTIQVLLAVAGLEFLGFGDSATVSWGNMLYGAFNGSALLQGAWWWFAPPGLCIALLGSGLALLNFGIDEIADPRLRRERPAKKKKEKAVA